MNKYFTVDLKTKIVIQGKITNPVKHTVTILQRDFKNVLGQELIISMKASSSSIILKYAEKEDKIFSETEIFIITFKNRNLYIIGSDDLGLIYGMLYISKEYLKINPFWYWAEQKPEKQKSIKIPMVEYQMPCPKIRFRGWFVNDETCLLGWDNVYPPTKKIWFPIFETLLRLEGNMIIPGTDLPRDSISYKFASDMGFWITHHHIEPLGAEMFIRRFFDKKPSYSDNPELFESLWREAVIKQKERKVVWVLGFRGQNDVPFWFYDPRYKKPKERGKMISRVIKTQLSILLEYVKNPAICTYIYGEITELYKKGYLELPEEIIKIWSDSGYGKMVSRRQNLDNPRIVSIPDKFDRGPHGIYYHVSFHDLQASNHLTMLTGVDFIYKELNNALTFKMDKFLLVNCGVIRPHIYSLEFISNIWLKGELKVDNWQNDFFSKYFPESRREIKEIYKKYFENIIQYGKNDDEKAGEEFYHYPVRQLISGWIKEKSNLCKHLIWATGKTSFIEQIKWLKNKCESNLFKWEKLKNNIEKILVKYPKDVQFIKDNILLQVILHYSGCKGVINFCESFIAFKEEKYLLSYLFVSRSIWSYQEGLNAMNDAEHGKWKDFYKGDWTTNIRLTIYALKNLRGYIRTLGDGDMILYMDWTNKRIRRAIGDQKINDKPIYDEELSQDLLKLYLKNKDIFN